MPIVTFRKGGDFFSEEMPHNTNPAVRAGTKTFPWPHLRYGCGMGKCGKCTCQVLAGAESLPRPNWKEQKVPGEERLGQGTENAKHFLNANPDILADLEGRIRATAPGAGFQPTAVADVPLVATALDDEELADDE